MREYAHCGMNIIRQVIDRLDRLLLWRRPPVELQGNAADCGYVCASLLLFGVGQHKSISDIKSEFGNTSRGLTLKQLRDILRFYGLSAEAIFFDRSRTSAFPCPGVVLLERGHYIALVSRAKDSFEVYDPNIGWYRTTRARLARQTQGFGLATSVPPGHGQKAIPRAPKLPRAFWNLFRNRKAAQAAAALVIAQLVTLALPLLSQRSIDSMVAGVKLSFLGTVGIGFVFVSMVSAITNFASSALTLEVTKRSAKKLGGLLFDKISSQPYSWFDRSGPSTIQSSVNALDAQFDYVVEALRTSSTLAVTIFVGMIAFTLVSPWLVIPGVIGAVISIAVDLWFNRKQVPLQAASVHSAQRRMALNFDMLTQLPLLARYGALRKGRLRYAHAVTRTTLLDAELQSIRNWKELALGLLRSADNLIFVTIAALFMTRGEYSLGTFVAMGAYKDLIGHSLIGMFALRQRYKGTEVYRLQTRDLTRIGSMPSLPSGELTDGRIAFENVSFRYGTLDPYVLHGASLKIEPGVCTAIRGQSGIGKSTIAKLMAGAIDPTDGAVMVGGRSAGDMCRGFSAVLQSDRLIEGTVRENIVMFRYGYNDDDVIEALEIAEADEYVLKLPMRLNTHVSENTAGLSGGQKQRLLLARALIGKPKVVVLDEATASLEVDRERSIISKIKEAGVTLVIISHRPEVWRMADDIVSVEEGKFRRLGENLGVVSKVA